MIAKSWIAIVTLFALALAVRAQETPRLEVFGGYSFDRAGFPFQNSSDVPNFGNGHGNLHGWNGSAALNLNRWLGVAADFAGHYGSATASKSITIVPPGCFIGCNEQITATLHSIHTFTFGPQISRRVENRTIFARALFGGARTRGGLSSFSLFPPLLPLTTQTSFAMILDGGADVGLSRRVAVRLQPGYLMTHILDQRQSCFRFSTGLVFRVGQ
jgi:hypothetical protein